MFRARGHESEEDRLVDQPLRKCLLVGDAELVGHLRNDEKGAVITVIDTSIVKLIYHNSTFDET